MSTTRLVPALADTLPPDALRFCAAHDLMPSLHHTIQLAEAVLRPVGPVRVELMVDPETGEEWLDVMVPVAGSVEDVVRRKQEYTRRRSECAPFSTLEKISTSLDVVEP